MNFGQYDLIKEAIQDLANISWIAYKAYKAEGFDDVQALHLTLNFQSNAMNMGGNEKK